MSNQSGSAIGNAFRIIECTREILKSGLPEQCPQCNIDSCRQALARHIAAMPTGDCRKD